MSHKIKMVSQNGPDDENDCFKQPHIAIELTTVLMRKQDIIFCQVWLSDFTITRMESNTYNMLMSINVDAST